MEERKKEFKNLYDIIIQKLENDDLYEEYQNKIINNNQQKFEILLEKLKFITDGIKNGVKEKDNTTRPFELLDYYLITKIDLTNMAKIINYLDKDIKKTLKIFIGKHKQDSPINKKTIFESTLIIKGHTVTDDEKLETVNFLNENKIPITILTYKQAIRRHIKGKLYPSEETNYNK